MASTKKRTVTKTVYDLELTYEEAEVLVTILARVGGRGRLRHLVEGIGEAITEQVPYTYNGTVDSSLTGNLILQDEE